MSAQIEVSWLIFSLLSLLAVGLFVGLGVLYSTYRKLNARYIALAIKYLDLANTISSAKLIVRKATDEEATSVLPNASIN